MKPITESFIFKAESASVLHCEKKVVNLQF